MLYAVIAVLAWGAVTGFLHAPHWTIPLGGLLAAGLAVWRERDGMLRPAAGQEPRRYLLLAAAFGFLALVGFGLCGATYGAIGWLHHR